MTVSNTKYRKGHTGDGSTVVFAYDFKIFLTSDLLVYVDGELKVLDTDYTVSGAGEEAGGNVTFAAAPDDGDFIDIIRNLPLTQLTNYIEGGKFPAETHEIALDRLIMLAQRLTGTSEPFATLEDSATPSVFEGKNFVTGAANTYTHFYSGIPGQEIFIIAKHAVTLTHGTNIFLNGATNWTMAVGDTITLKCYINQKWYEKARSDNT